MTSPAQDHVPEDLDLIDLSYWLDTSAEGNADNRVLVDIPLLTTPITDADLKAAGIADLEVQVQSQGANPSWISNDQPARIEHLLPPWPSAIELEEELTVSFRGASFGDPLQNRAVEEAAMRAVRAVYEVDGWQVEDVSGLKRGWDLTCTRGDEVIKAEVKGVGGDRPKVLLTGERTKGRRATQGVDAGRGHTSAERPPACRSSRHTGAQALEAAEPYVFQADLTAFTGAAADGVPASSL